MPNVSLETENGTSYVASDVARIAQTVRELDADANSFAILSRDDDNFLQAALNPDGSWSLEYRAGSAEQHFAAIDRDLDEQRVSQAFCSYAAGTDFKAGFSWRPFHSYPSDNDARPAPLSEAEETRDRMLAELYGIAFPHSLFQFHSFISGRDSGLWETARAPLGLSATGPLQVLLRFETAAEVRPLADMLLHWRFYRDPPEFFTYMHGDTDGLHWGLLLDSPVDGFRGAASYYNNDADLIRVYGGLFDALFQHAGDLVSSLSERIADDPESEDYYREGVADVVAFTRALRGYVVERGIPVVEATTERVTSETGLGAILSHGTSTAVLSLAGGSQAAQAEALLKACRAGRPGGALLLGRELWHFGGTSASETAYTLLRAAYEALGRKELVRVLDTHFRGRDRKSVDVLEAT